MRNSISSLLIVTCCSFGIFANAQKISDGETVDVNGLKVSFNIMNKESIQAGGKTFDRYKVAASVKNTSDKSYNIRLTSYPQIVMDTGIVE